MKRAIVDPAVPAPEALSELKDWLGITTATEDESLTALLCTAIACCEAYTGVMPLLCRCEEVLAASDGWQRLSASPVQAITGLWRLDGNGGRIALPVSTYIFDLDADGGGRVRLTAPVDASRLVVRFDAGLSAGWSTLPEALHHGILRLAAEHYRQRDAADLAALPSATVAALWRPWRRLRLA